MATKCRYCQCSSGLHMPSCVRRQPKKIQAAVLLQETGQPNMTFCPRCNRLMPNKRAGHGVSVSRRGPIMICADCGMQEALIDAGMIENLEAPRVLELNLQSQLGKKYRRPDWL